MKPVVTPDTNVVFMAPGCGDLPATTCHDPETGTDYVETVWELSLEELKKVNETGRIYVCIKGNGIQPIFISTESVLKDGDA